MEVDPESPDAREVARLLASRMIEAGGAFSALSATDLGWALGAVETGRAPALSPLFFFFLLWSLLPRFFFTLLSHLFVAKRQGWAKHGACEKP